MSYSEESFADDKNLLNFSTYENYETKISLDSFPKFSRPHLKANCKGENSSPSIDNSFNSKNSNEDKNLPKISGWRRAITEDKPAIRQLQSLTGDIADLLYRARNIDELIEKSYFPIVQLDSNGELISFTACDSYPNIPSVPTFFWTEWLNGTYRLNGASARTVLFIHYMVWQPEQGSTFLRLLLQTSFTEFIHLKHIIIVKPPLVNVPDFYAEYFIPVLPSDLEKLDVNSIQTLLVCLRASVIHPLTIRTAFTEEFDIILSIIKNRMNNKSNKDQQYGLDFISFIYQKSKKTLICELEGVMAGFMILNMKIDLDSLNEGFELAPFHGLRKRGENLVEPEIFSRSEDSSLRINKTSDVLISSEFLFSQMNWELTLAKIRGTESSYHFEQGSSTLTDSESSEFTFIKLSSIFDLKKSVMEEASDSQKNISTLTSRGKYDHTSKLGDLKVAVRTSISTAPHFYLPRFHGSSNAFLIDFFAVDCNRVDEKLASFDFLEAAFKIVPDRDYCVLIIPTDFVPLPLLDLFVRVTPRPMSSFKRELYLCHKNSLLITSMTVRSTEINDLTAVYNFLRNVDENNVIYQDIVDCFNKNNESQSFILTEGEQIIGLSLINCHANSENFHLYFEIENYADIEMHKTEDQSVIKHLILNPTYQNHARFFIKDIMRLADLTCLYYIYNGHQKNQRNMLTALGEFIPIKPKRKAGYNEKFLNIHTQTSSESAIDCPCSLYFLDTRSCGFTKFHVNIIIVVVGASRTALSFLESLIFGPTSSYITYNNLICVTPHGVDSKAADSETKDFMFPLRDNYCRKYRSRLSLEAYVSFIFGVMTEINRTEKYIVVNNKATVRYDYLILTCGLQYLSPMPKAKENLKKNCCGKNFKSSLGRFLLRPEEKKLTLPRHPHNMFIINTTQDAKNALLALQGLVQKAENIKRMGMKIIVYGHNLHVFLTIQTLLKLGIPGESIAFIEPFPIDTKSVTVFNDRYVDQAVIESIKNLNVQYYTTYFLYDWSVTSDDYITSITFHSKLKQIVIPCLAFFPFVQKLVSEVTFKACNNAGLVYDGRLVINHNFRTNDQYIYAAGPLTKYARRYYANDKAHQFFSSSEVGERLADIIRSKIDPYVEDISNKVSDLVPQLNAPLILHCQLPGNFNYFVVRKPGKMIDLETAYNIFDYGEVLTTGDCHMLKGHGYFRLHLDAQGFVESIVCYTKDKIDYMNLSSLYGLHERLLNNLLFQYDLGRISDFFSYFRQPWALALFHERFRDLKEYNLEAFEQKLSKKDKTTFAEEITNKISKRVRQSIPTALKQMIDTEYEQSRIKEEIKDNVLEFLKCYSKDLPVYATPSVMSCLLFEKTKSSLF